MAGPASITVAMAAAAAVAAGLGERWLDAQGLALFFVLPVVMAAIRYGWRAALGASLLSVVAINFLFVEPRHTLVVARVKDLAALVLFSAVGILVSVVAEQARAAGAARLEAARERFKSELMAGVSHDLRTPLATILFALQSLQKFSEEHAPEDRTELVALAEREARRLTGLVESLLSGARLEAGKTPVRLEPVSVEDVAAAALEDLRTDLAGLAVHSAIPGDLPLMSADAALAVRALANVLLNAARYGAGSAVSVTARCANHHVLIEVADRGPGLGDDPERLFEKFVRGAADDGRSPGLGLGLPLARGFMEMQGGALTAANRAGGGAVFTLAFPCWTKAARDVG